MKRSKIRGKRVKENLIAYAFMLPSFIFLFIFIIYPLLYSFYLSLSKYDFVYDSGPTFIGIGNYIRLFSDRVFLDSLRNTLYFSAVFFPILIIVSLINGVALNTEVRGYKLFRTIVFLPFIVALSIGGVMWSWIYSEHFGILNFVLENVLKMPQLAHDWLTDTNTVLNCLIVVKLWKYIGIVTILFIAGLGAISKDLYDAAKVDGAGAWERFVFITLPNLRGAFLITGVYGIIQAVKTFQLPFVMTEGGPGTATMTLYFYLWNNAFLFFKMGYAASVGYFTGAIIIILSLVLFKFTQSRG